MILQNLKYKCINDFNVQRFYEAVLDWVENTKDLRYFMEIKEEDFNGSVTYQYDHKQLQIIDDPADHRMAALHTGVDATGVTWKLSIVYCEDDNTITLRISNSIDSAGNPHYVRSMKKCDFIDEMVDLRIIANDGALPILYKPRYVEPGKTAQLASIMKKQTEYRLPVIYITENSYGFYPVKVEDMADHYSGLAHVFVQDGEKVTEELKAAGVQGSIPHNGAIAVYYGSKNISTSIFKYSEDERKTLQEIERSIAYYHRSQDYGELSTFETVAARVISGDNHDLRRANDAINQKIDEISAENQSLLSSFDQDLKANEEQIAWLEKRVAELEKQNALLNAQLAGRDRKPLLYVGEEEDLYPGEIHDVLMDILAQTSVTEGSRREHILQDLLNANEPTKDLEQRHAEVKEIFLGYRDLTPDKLKRLQKLGFRITSEGKHHKLVYYEPRYNFTIPKSSSDNRAGKNAAAIIIKTMM